MTGTIPASIGNINTLINLYLYSNVFRYVHRTSAASACTR